MKINNYLTGTYGTKELDQSLIDKIMGFLVSKRSRVSNIYSSGPKHREIQKLIYNDPSIVFNGLEKILFKGLEIPLGETEADVVVLTNYNLHIFEIKKTKRKGRGIAGRNQLTMIYDALFSEFKVQSRLFSVVWSRKKGLIVKEKIILY